MKGDYVIVRFTTPGGNDMATGVHVETSGRRLRIEKDRVFIRVREATRTGTTTRTFTFRLDAVTSIETKGEDVEE